MCQKKTSKYDGLLISATMCVIYGFLYVKHANWYLYERIVNTSEMGRP